MAIQPEHEYRQEASSIAWAISWPRTRADRNDDWHGFAALTQTELIIAQPKDTSESARALQLKTHNLLQRAAAQGRAAEDFSNLDMLIRSTSNVVRIARSEIIAIQALPKGNLFRISTPGAVHVIGGISNKEWVTHVGTELASVLAPTAEPRAVPRPKLNRGLLRQLAIAPVTVAFFAMVAIIARLLIGDGSRTVSTRGRNRLLEETLGAIPLVVLIAGALIITSAVVVRMVFRARDAIQWDIAARQAAGPS